MHPAILVTVVSVVAFGVLVGCLRDMHKNRPLRWYECSNGFVSEMSKNAHIGGRNSAIQSNGVTYVIPQGVSCRRYKEAK